MFEWVDGIQKFLDNNYTKLIYKCMSPDMLNYFLTTFLLPKFNSPDDESIVK